jgi:hypothetical protein
MVLLDLVCLPQRIDGGIGTVVPLKEQDESPDDIGLVLIGITGGAKVGFRFFSLS